MGFLSMKYLWEMLAFDSYLFGEEDSVGSLGEACEGNPI